MRCCAAYAGVYTRQTLSLTYRTLFGIQAHNLTTIQSFKYTQPNTMQLTTLLALAFSSAALASPIKLAPACPAVLVEVDHCTSGNVLCPCTGLGYSRSHYDYGYFTGRCAEYAGSYTCCPPEGCDMMFHQDT